MRLRADVVAELLAGRVPDVYCSEYSDRSDPADAVPKAVRPMAWSLDVGEVH